MDGALDTPPLPPEFSSQQLGLMRELKKLPGGFALEQMLDGAARAVRDEDNPEALVHAAQSARELVEKFEHSMHGLTAETLRKEARESFKDMADGFKKRWVATKSGSKCFVETGWKGKIDPPLHDFLNATDEFFSAYAQHNIYRKNKEQDVVIRLDPMFSALSENEQERVIREWVGLRGFFNRVAHHGEGDATRAKMEDALDRLVRYLHRRLAPVDAENKEAIRAHTKAWETRGVTEEALKALPGLLDSGADSAFFFSSLKSPEWLSVLDKGGYFASPPPPVPRGDAFLHPTWPQSRYLAVVAASSPATTAAIAAAIPQTANVNVNEDLFRVAVALPAENVGAMVGRVHRWLKNVDVRWHSQGLAKFVRHTAQGGNIRGALGILEDVLKFSAVPHEEGDEPKKGSLFSWTPEPKTRLDHYEYGELLRAVLPALTKADARKTLAMLCRILDGYVHARGRPNARQPGYDGSVYWRPAIDESGQNSSFDEVTELVSSIRRLGDDEMKAGRLALSGVLVVARAFKWDIFRRLEMHWLRASLSNATSAMLTEALINREHLRSDRFDLEYGQLLQAAFGKLRSRQQRAILDWIAKGPQMPKGGFKGRGRGAGELGTQAQAWMNSWRVKKLYWIKDQLPAAHRANYDRWVAEGGEPAHPGFHVWSGGIEEAIQQSPIPLPEFKALTLGEQAAYLRTWVPTGDPWRGPSRQALAGVFHAAVAQNVAPFIEQAALFVGLVPEYVGVFFSALWETLKDGTPHAMKEVWTLAHWLLKQPDGEKNLFDEFTRKTRRSRRWYSARLALARLLHGLLRAEKNSLPFTERKQVWSLLEKLAVDPDPTVRAKAEQGNDEDSMGPFNLSINTIRGEAFHAIFEYVSWCWRATVKKGWMGLPPEVKRLLAEHLKPSVEPTLAIRSVYGVSVDRLIFWDRAWFERQRERIFPGAAHQKLDAIAWGTFITHAQPIVDSFNMLREQFRRAIREMAPPVTGNSRLDPRVALGRYLIVIYWWGHLDFTALGDLLAEFFDQAPDEVRAGVIQFVGRSLKDAPVVDPEVAARLVRLWEWRLQVARSGPGHAEEMGAFAWWFDAGKLDVRWSAAQMLEALMLSRRHQNQFMWMRRFAELAEPETALAVQALELTCETARNAGVMFFNDEEAATILRAGLRSTDPDVVDRAKRVQNAFLREGRTRFLDLS